MPPSGHSHSSHSSSHSSHSSHSHSSHSSRSHSSSSHSSYQTKTRTNQPKGWSTARHGNCMNYNFSSHDYVYYPHDWTDEDGIAHKEGYYDEDGQYFLNIASPDVDTMLTCSYCGNKMIYRWQEGVIPTCPSCAAQYQIERIERVRDYSNGFVAQNPRQALKAIGIIYGILAIFLFLTSCPIMLYQSIIQHAVNNVTYTSSTTNQPTSVYVEEIGRNCRLDGEDYYDSDAECWFWFNDEISPGQWQYWYEGISSNFGSYGWMEYDDDNDVWYIEVSSDRWAELVLQNDAMYAIIDDEMYVLGDSSKFDKLWHFNDAHTNNLY